MFQGLRFVSRFLRFRLCVLVVFFLPRSLFHQIKAAYELLLEALSGEGLDQEKASKLTGVKPQSAAVKAALSVVKPAKSGSDALNQRAQALAAGRAAAAGDGNNKPGLSETEG